MVIAKFNKNNKDYVYVLINNKIKYGYISNNSICYNLNDNEIQLMNNYISLIFISSDSTKHYKCGTKEYNNKVFEIYYDEISKRKYFLPKPSYEEYCYLNNLYNPTILYSVNDNFIKEVNKTSNKTIAISVGSVAVLALFNFVYLPILHPIVVNNEYNLVSAIYKDYSLEDLPKIIDQNIYINNEEKTFIKSNLNIVYDYKDYFDYDLIASRLSNLKINHKKRKEGTAQAGFYNTVLNFIDMYSYDGEPINEKTLTHELTHVFTKANNLGIGIQEGITDIISREYCDNSINEFEGVVSYPAERIYVYMLFELIDPEIIRKSYFNGDFNPIIDALEEIIPDREKAYQFISSIDNLTTNINELARSGKKEEIKVIAFKPSNLYNEYFTSKYGYDISNDDNVSTYMELLDLIFYNTGYSHDSRIGARFEKFNPELINCLPYDRTVIPKVLFNKELMQELYLDEPQIIFKEELNSKKYEYRLSNRDIQNIR